MSFDEFSEFMKCIDVTNIQWVVEWWHISSIVNYNFKDSCVPLVGLRCYSYHSTFRIQGNLVIIKELLVMMVRSIPWHLLIRSWEESVSIGHKGG